MTLASLLAISALLRSLEQNQVPSLTVLKISTSETIQGNCDVTLMNNHSRSALAWVITRLPDRRSAGTSDNTTVPDLGVAPGETKVTRFSCPEGEPLPAVEVTGVLYDDGSRAGDEAVLERSLFSVQRERARALRELATFLSATQLSAKPNVSLTDLFSELIDQASGAGIGAAGARLSAKNAVQRFAQHASGTPISAEQIDAAKRAVTGELIAAAARLEMWSQK